MASPPWIPKEEKIASVCGVKYQPHIIAAFLQMALSLYDENNFDASAFPGILMEVAGNKGVYNMHLLTSSLRFPWQSYRVGFKATFEWQTIRIPFSDLLAYKTSEELSKDKLKRIGRYFQVNLFIATLRFKGNDF